MANKTIQQNDVHLAAVPSNLSAYTPGPWRVEDSFGAIGHVTDANGECVAQAQSRVPLRHTKPDSERLANAKLIAAAPELLEALVRCASLLSISLNHNSESHYSSPVRQNALAVIAKALGK